MNKCHLIIDSCCDLPRELINQKGISLLNFPYINNGETYSDDLFESITPKEFYDGMRRGNEPSTAQLPIPLLRETFERAAKSGTPTVYLSFTSGLSGSYDAAVLVQSEIQREYPEFELRVVDTLLPSVAEGLLIFEAIKLWEQGYSAQELASWAEEARYFVDCQFMVEDLNTLKRGGRIPSSVAVAGSALDVKPLLSVDSDGKLQLTGVARGRKKGIAQLASYLDKNVSDEGRTNYIVIGNADAKKDAERLRCQIDKLEGNYIIIDANIGPVIGSHVGPGMLAVSFWGKDRRDNLSLSDKIAKKIKGISSTS